MGRVNVVTGHVKTQLIAHDKEVYDIAFSRAGGGRDMFASVGKDFFLTHSFIFFFNLISRLIIRTTSEKSKPINISGIRQGDSLSRILFNIIMDKIIDQIAKELGYKMGETPIPIVCYVDDVVLMAEIEDDLQALLDIFNTNSVRPNMKYQRPRQNLWS